MFRLKEFLQLPRHRAATMSSSGFIVARSPEILPLTSAKSRQAYFSSRPWSMGGPRRDRRISRRDSYNAGKRTGGKYLPTVNSLPAQKLSPRQAAQHRLFELSGCTSRSLFSAVHIIAEHLRYHAIAAEEVHLKTMSLLLRARFRVDTADVFFRLRIRTFSSWHNWLTTN